MDIAQKFMKDMGELLGYVADNRHLSKQVVHARDVVRKIYSDSAWPEYRIAALTRQMRHQIDIEILAQHSGELVDVSMMFL